MATIEKLAITGIRSFGDDESGRQVIPFEKPVTLILGENGCGKSTIIECLRYVTTQKEPYGKSVFVRDPDLCYNQTVKGQVKLRLKNSTGDEIHLARSLQATRIRKGITQKSLDATISIKKRGSAEAVQVSTRCIDAASETLRHMGTSKAILDNVVFCSQEDSFWPLESDKALKEKFDQIFDSEKYNKCLKRVKDLQKSLKQKKSLMDQDVEYNREKKTLAEAKRNEVTSLNKQIEDFNIELGKFQAQLDPINDKLKDIDKQERELSNLYTSKETTKTQLSGIEREESDLRTRLQGCEYVGSDQELDIALSELNCQSRNTNELKCELQILKNEELGLEKEIGNCLSRMGQLTKSVEINKSKIADKNKKIQEIASQCSISNDESDILRYIGEKKKGLNTLQKEHELSEENLQSVLNEARDSVVHKERDIERNKGALRDNENEIKSIKRDLDNAGESQIRRERIANELRLSEKELSEHQKSIDPAQLSTKLQRIQNELKTTESELVDTEKEVRRLQSHSGNGLKLEYHKAELEKKETEVRRLINIHRETFTEVLNCPVPESNFKRAVEQHADKLFDEAKDLRNKEADRDSKRISLLSRVANINSDLDKKNAELKGFQAKVFDLTKGVDLNETLNVTKMKVDELHKDKGHWEASRHMFEAYIKKLQQKPCCPVCLRDFAAREEVGKLIEQLNTSLQKVPRNLQEVESNLQERQRYLRKLYDLESIQQTMDKLRLEEVPSLNAEEAEKKAAITQATKDLEEIRQKLERIEKNRERCTSVLGDMALIDQDLKVIENIKSSIRCIEPLIPTGWSKELLKKTEETRDVLASKRKDVEAERNSIQRQLTDYNEKLSMLQSKKHKLAEEELSLRSKDGQQKVQEDRLITLQNLGQNLLLEIEASRAEIIPLKERHLQLGDELRKLKEKNKTTLKSEQSKLDGIMVQFRDVERLQREISEFGRKGDDVKLEALKDDISQRESTLRTTKLKIENVNSKLGDMAEIEVRRHNLEDNKTMREKSREKERLKKKLAELEKSFGQMGYEGLVREKRRLRAKEEEIGQRKAYVNGKMGALKAQKESIENELESSMYKNIEDRFRESFIAAKITEAQSQDLHRYAVAMDHAMGVYHKQAMERVNAHIHEYWAKIYRGNDIDSIEIQTEQAQNTENRRLFNYKLVQKKGDSAIDMRNRCSAGQKMLACLIVRMALAEVFSSNCGILTLDEPTTNLDKKNISMLAEALNELITAKSQLARSNFQLIIITHDKDFMRQIIEFQGVDRYINVTRKLDGTSLVTTRNATELSG